MKNYKLKVCGMRDPKNVMDVASLNPDYMGFIFYEGSKRFVGPDFTFPEKFPESVKRVGVFVNDSVENILDKVAVHQLRLVQLHGDESVEMCNKLKDSVEIIKVFRIDETFDFNSTRHFKSCADFFLFDTNSESYGGSGKIFNWKLLKKYDQEIPFFLSGGLSIENIDMLNELNDLNIHALDLNSRVESAPGIKDINKLNAVFSILNPEY